jgi:glycosyltransferase involved in cell wall biosynthesis
LLKAASLLRERWPDVWYLLVGDGESRADLIAEACDLGLGDRVVFAGQQPHEPNLHHLFDVSVLCSRNEAFPNTVIEAMAAGTPVVATAVGGVPDAVEDGVTGRLVRASDPDQLAGVLEELLADPGVCQSLGAAGQACARDRYVPSRALSELEALYERLIA